MNLIQTDEISKDRFRHKTAFVLNRHARHVHAQNLYSLQSLIPQGDLYVCHNLDDSLHTLRTIIQKQYSRIIIGGGDGTIVHLFNQIVHLLKQELTATDVTDYQPTIGLLRLGTGNALAYALQAGEAMHDTIQWTENTTIENVLLKFVKIEESSQLSMFVGFGLEAGILHDYAIMKEKLQSWPRLLQVLSGVRGYFASSMLWTLPRAFWSAPAHATVTTLEDAYAIEYIDGKDIPKKYAAGSVLYDGPANAVSIGSIPYFGYGFKMFPHLENNMATHFAHAMQLRIGTPSIPHVVAHLPSAWRGQYRDKRLLDFVVQSIRISFDREVPMQSGGDLCGLSREETLTAVASPLQWERIKPTQVVTKTSHSSSNHSP